MGDGGAGPDMAYQPSQLRAGGSTASAAGATAESAATVLRGVSCPPGASFGRVAGADLLATALGRARDTHARTGVQVADHHANLDARATSTAGQGDGLTTSTTGIASGTRAR